MDEVKRELVKSGVIGRVLDDFDPRVQIVLFYGDKQISLGDGVTPAEVQQKPSHIHHLYNFLDRELQETFKERKLAAIVSLNPIFLQTC